MNETVTVIIPFKNEERYIKKSIESILNQTYTDLDILCLDDYSTDKSVEICNSFNDKRLRVYSKKSEATGLSVSRNLGVDLALGEYVVFHDADDEALPTKIEKQVALINQHGPNTIAGTWIEKIIGGESHELKLPIQHKDIIKGFERVYNRVTIVAGIICARRDVFLKNRYNENQKYQQDWDFLLRIYESGQYQFHNVPEFLYKYLIKATGTKFRGDWIHWNMLVRKNQEMRRKKRPEFLNPEEMYKETKKHPLAYLKLKIMVWLVILKNKISYEVRQATS